VLALAGAIRQGSGGPPILQRYWTEQALWQRLGVRLGPERAGERPHREVEDYLLIIQLTAREEAARARAAPRPGPR
jgi:hypothetical protein